MRTCVGLCVAMALAGAPAAWAEERVSRLIYFDWEVTTLDAKGKAIVAEIAPMAKRCENNGVRVFGHADRSHTEDVSSEIAKARTYAVRDELVAKGVASSAISPIPQNEYKPAVETADGVREAKNRRVEIVLVCD